MGVYRVDYAGQTLIDISNSKITPNTLCVNGIGYDKNGDMVIGANPYEKTATDAIVLEQAGLIEELYTILSART